jgi:hypothetical protein
MATLAIRTAEELRALDSLQRQVSRRAARETPLVQQILRLFVARGGPISVEDVIAASGDSPSAATRDALLALDEDDLVRVRAGHIDIAYPFSATPTPFVVQLPDGRERYACCAMDALGIAPMLDQQVQIRSRCHHCGMPLEFSAAPSGPGPESEGVMLWFGKRGDERCKVADSL